MGVFIRQGLDTILNNDISLIGVKPYSKVVALVLGSKVLIMVKADINILDIGTTYAYRKFIGKGITYSG
jgi:hypothetical protein